ncbi:DNA-binding protein Ets97D [Operophtera brumata]|uniref:DNA-binding protein Ets97D n=1 Tax=Operophtera brumata TaxID=104452 RepID=A0A0L7L5Q0_OPEBR|nr:DNA-binding protein Ets97D [Operophtera brumata]
MNKPKLKKILDTITNRPLDNKPQEWRRPIIVIAGAGFFVSNAMEVSDFSDILNVRAIKMEASDVVFEENAVDSTDTFPLPQYVTESDLGMTANVLGEGIVQVNIQIRALDKKINILDVLKPDEEFNLTGVRLSDWNVDGTELCALTNAAFKLSDWNVDNTELCALTNAAFKYVCCLPLS